MKRETLLDDLLRTQKKFGGHSCLIESRILKRNMPCLKFLKILILRFLERFYASFGACFTGIPKWIFFCLQKKWQWNLKREKILDDLLRTKKKFENHSCLIESRILKRNMPRLKLLKFWFWAFWSHFTHHLELASHESQNEYFFSKKIIRVKFESGNTSWWYSTYSKKVWRS